MSRMFLFLLVVGSSVATAHDTWVQTNTQLARVGDAVHIDLMLGNHGNDHRDFKLAGKVDLTGTSLVVVAPSGQQYDLMDRLVDVGYAPREGFHAARFMGSEAGLYIVAHRSDRIVDHGQPQRSVKSAKTCFLLSDSLDKPSAQNPGFDKPLGHVLEIVPVANPVVPMGPGQTMRVRVLFQGRPLAGVRVSFIPRGQTLAAGWDERFERSTDAAGEAAFTPTEGNYYLIVVHHMQPEERGTGYTQTKYSATLTMLVPHICLCCGE